MCPHSLKFYREMLRIGRQISDLSEEERLRKRQEKTVPLLAKFEALARSGGARHVAHGHLGIASTMP